ncbi:MAG: ATP-binding protein [Ignavibacteriales bacterium]|nr:ATP-binding protein [Ignavibacteriales bacterium]
MPQPSRKAGILCFMFDHNNILWCSIQGLGVYVADVSSGLRTIRIIGSKEGLHSTSCRTLYEDHDGTIWIGGFSEGVACLERDSLLNGRPRVFTETDGLPDGHISRFTEDADGKLLAGTILGGLSVFDQGRFHAITTQDGLMSAVIRSMAKTPSGDVMVGTQRGLQLYNPRHHPAFSVVNEIAGNTIWTCGAYRDRFIWVITTGELLLYEYQPRSVQLAPPPIYITRLSVNGKSRNVDQAIELTYDQNNVILDYVGISFKNEQLNRYRYRMLETDSDWRPPTKQTSVTYAALKPGTYTFEVKAINSDGVESTNSASMSFVILSPFWMRWWFILLANILVLTIIAIVYRYRLNQLLKIERMRTQIATDLHDDIGASLTRIALFSEVAKEEAANASPKLVEMAEKIGTNARELLDSVGTLVWSIDPRHDRFEDVITNLKNFAQEMFSMKGIDHRFTVQNQASQLNLPLDARKNILLVFKEAINNIVKHANCQTVVIDLALRDGQFEMQIADDGKGIASTIFRPGHGLMNMRMRARAIGGEFDIQTTKGAGTTIVLKLPVKT